LVEEEAQEAFFAVYDATDLERYASEKGMSLKTTELFSRNERIKEVMGSPEFNDQAFSLQEGVVSSPLRIGDRLYLIKVIKREDPRIPAFHEVKEKVRKEVLREKAMDRAKSMAEDMLEETKTSKTMAESAMARGLEVEETGLFERSSTYVPEVGPAEHLGKDIFSLSPDSALLDKIVSYGGLFFVMELKEEEETDMEKFESEKEEYSKKLYAEKRGRILRQWLDSLRERSEIKIREENLRL
jgi:hypothetical protein